MWRSEADRLVRAVISIPMHPYFRLNPERALAQHAVLRDLLTGLGVELIEIPELLGHPDSIFVRDAALCTPDGFIWLRMGASSRREEADWLGEVLRERKVPRIGIIQVPGTVEGGDVLLAGHVAFVGRSARTNAEGADQMARLLTQLGYEVRLTYVTEPYLHLDDALSVVGPGRLLTCAEAFPAELFKGFKVIEVPGDQPFGGNVLTLGPNQVVVESSNTAAIEVLANAGVKVYMLDLSEFLKEHSGPGGLILPVARQAAG